MRGGNRLAWGLSFVTVFAIAGSPAAPRAANKPNILFIMGDDIGWYDVSAYNMGLMGYPK